MAVIIGTNGADTITPAAVSVPFALFPGPGADSIDGRDGHDRLDGGGGNDTVLGGLGDDTVLGAGGDDLIDLWVGDNSADGGAGNDTLLADKDADTLRGGENNDSISGGAGLDRLFGDLGLDTLDGGSEADTLDGGGDADLLRGGSEGDLLLGGAGADTLEGGVGADTLDGGADADWASYAGAATGVVARLGSPAANAGEAAGDAYVGIENLAGTGLGDTLVGDGGGNTLHGLGGADFLDGGGGSDSLVGGDGADTLNGGAQSNRLLGGDGDDLLVANFRNGSALAGEIFGGGTGRDRLSLEDVQAAYGAGAGAFLLTRIFVDLLTGYIQTDRVGAGAADGLFIGELLLESGAGPSFGIEDVTGSSIADRILGDNTTNLLDGRDGGDTLQGEGGADTLLGGAGNDLLEGGSGLDRIEGGADADTLVGGGSEAETLDGGSGGDMASYAHILLAMTISLADPTRNAGGIFGDVLVSIEHLMGGLNNDGLYGDAGANLLRGGGGGDTLEGAAGADTLLGDDGDDLLLVGLGLGDGTDSVDGGAGRDRIDLSGATSPPLAGFFVTLGGLAAVRDFGTTLVSIAANSVEDIVGSRFDDVLAAAETGSLLDGGDGDDELVGFGGADTLIGGNGSDHLEGGEGRDLVSYEFATQAARVFTSFGQRSQNAGAALGDTLTGVEDLRGSAFDDQLTGSGSLANQLEGLAGADTLVGGGGDTLIGGTGADVYVLNDPGAVIVEVADGSRSRVQVNYVLPGLFEGFHDLTLLGSVRNGIGNGLDNHIAGNAAANILDGGDGADTLDGAAGADVLVGGAGLDVFIVDHLRDIVVDDEGDGGQVQASVSWTLGDDLAELRLTGAQAIDGAGNAGANRLIGNGAANRLDGRDGADTINAGSGDDLLLGGSGRDRLRGDGGADTLNGGLEKDTLTGSAGADLFLVTTRPGDLFDIISDFAAEDRIGVLLSAFDLAGTSGLAAGSLAGQGSRLEQNLTGHATLAETRFVYDTDSGQLYFDADGAGGAARAIVVRLAAAPGALQPDDIFLL